MYKLLFSLAGWICLHVFGHVSYISIYLTFLFFFAFSVKCSCTFVFVNHLYFLNQGMKIHAYQNFHLNKNPPCCLCLLNTYLRVLPCSPEGGTLIQSLVVLAGLGNTLLVQEVGAENTLGKGTDFELRGTVYKVAEEDIGLGQEGIGLDKIVVFPW